MRRLSARSSPTSRRMLVSWSAWPRLMAYFSAFGCLQPKIFIEMRPTHDATLYV